MDSFNYGLVEVADIASELVKFREHWLLELNQSTKSVTLPSDTYQQSPSKEDEARFLYLRGVEAENDGRLLIATQYYRRAFQIEPCIESKVNAFNSDIDYEEEIYLSDDDDDDEDNDNDCDMSDLVTYFSRLDSNLNRICQPHIQQNINEHFSILPREVMREIIRWIVGEHLDVETLATLSKVCRGFYICSRDETIWKLICQRIFGVNCQVKLNSYKNLYLEVPHLRYSGCYISRSTYFRAGEKNFEMHSIPFHLVEYYRYIHFFPSGEVLMLTSPDDPASTVSSLKNKNSVVSGILSGYYTISSDVVNCVLRRKTVKQVQLRRQRHLTNNDQDQTFFVKLTIKDTGRRKFSLLTWLSYSIHTKYRKSGEEMMADFELRASSYPPLYFSVVRSYTANPQVPL